MSKIIDEQNFLQSLNPRAITGYLKDHGWLKDREYGENAAIYHIKIDESEHEVLVPFNPQIRDFTSLMSMLIKDVSEIEQRSENDIRSDLSTAAFDVIRIRSLDADEIGSMPMESAIELHNRAKDIMIAVANAAAATTPKASYNGRRLEQVNAYALQGMRLGQSQRGSFVLSILSKWDFVPPSEDSQGWLLPQEDVHFGRKVTQTFSKALLATRKALTRSADGDIEKAFSDAIPDGVSSNFCKALSDIARDCEGINIGVNWSFAKPELKTGAVLKLTSQDAQTLSEASRALQEKEPLISFGEIEGFINTITTTEINNFDGSVTLQVPYENKLRSVKIKFSDTDRNKIFDAGKHRKKIRMEGEIKSTGSKLELINPKNIEILESIDE
jgi:hypothetical protein